MRRLPLVFITFIALMVPFTHGLTFSHLLTYMDGDNLGQIYFIQDFTATYANWNPTNIIFYDFQMNPQNFGALGLSCSNNTTLNVTLCTPLRTDIKLNTPANNTLTGSIYAPSRTAPQTIIGADTWGWDNAAKTLTFTSDTNSTLTVVWTGGGTRISILVFPLIIFITLAIMLSRRRR